ncbi:MAG: hypothetical protein HQK54_12230 [Oligoflexales bacterium]|nr:hypothetical protein [Oligoflexales bacterium]
MAFYLLPESPFEFFEIEKEDFQMVALTQGKLIGFYALMSFLSITYINGCKSGNQNSAAGSLVMAENTADGNTPKMEVNNAVMQGQKKICEADMKVAWNCKFLKHVKKFQTTQEGQACGIEIRDADNKVLFEKYPNLNNSWGDTNKIIACGREMCVVNNYLPEVNFDATLPGQLKQSAEFSIAYRVKWRLDYNLAGGRTPVEGVLCAQYAKGQDGCWTMKSASQVPNTSQCLSSVSAGP